GGRRSEGGAERGGERGVEHAVEHGGEGAFHAADGSATPGNTIAPRGRRPTCGPLSGPCVRRSGRTGKIPPRSPRSGPNFTSTHLQDSRSEPPLDIVLVLPMSTAPSFDRRVLRWLLLWSLALA